MKKRFLSICALAFVAVIAGGCGGKGNSGGGSENSSGGNVQNTPVNIRTYFSDTTGKAELLLNADATLQTVGSATVIGANGAEEIVVDGGENQYEIVATGTGLGAIMPASGTLVFKNVTFIDNTDTVISLGNMNVDWGVNYLEFGGNIRFENCDFECPIFLKDEADAEFVNCSFESRHTRMYGVWVFDGAAAFTGCSFEGTRGLKIHEEYSSISVVSLDGCQFKSLTVKPGIAVGTVDAETTLTVKNCIFMGCQPCDGIEGVDGYYESDTPRTSYTFISENNEVDGILEDAFVDEKNL